ncbi:MAG TPA: hypothetical protein VF867_16630 [Arthrobacter sp.]
MTASASALESTSLSSGHEEGCAGTIEVKESTRSRSRFDPASEQVVFVGEDRRVRFRCDSCNFGSDDQTFEPS